MASASAPIDFRSDTVTQPCDDMKKAMISAPLGDDVMGEDPTVLKLESMLASQFGKEAALFFPTGTQSNLCGVMAHCHGRGSEVLLGANSHLCLYEHGNLSTLGGIHSRQIPERSDATLDPVTVEKMIRVDDPHFPRTDVVCIENTHNVLGGVPLPKSYIDSLSKVCVSNNLKLHIDGARIMNACVAMDVSAEDLCENVDSVSICLSKGLGSPVGSVLVGSEDLIYLARRQRKACGGGMRQAGVIAGAGIFAIENNVERLADDHARAKAMASVMKSAGFVIDKEPQTNLLFFGVPDGSKLMQEDVIARADDAGILFGGGYSGGTRCRIAIHKHITDACVKKAGEVLTDVATGF
ncbi:hypothetical protein TrST_g10830 [Triparma strigata]|uniref:Aromatic amino acid beta-eliminating lyase/threonine aldolase domain-containing protein n=1 Tax=Triparma strigata TaxID=1606541 RepID=A0A9W7AZD8_9STRA|nr:hypothetical protein TrST_g10830 [Triparma strigata]